MDLNKEEEKLIKQYRKDNEGKQNTKDKKNKKYTNSKTYSKKWLSRLLVLLCIWVSITYILIAYSIMTDKDYNIVSSLVELSKTALTVILGDTLGYFVKSFAETRAEKKARLDYLAKGMEYDNTEQ